MLNFIRKLVKFSSSARGAKVILAAWIVVVAVLSFIAPSSKDFSTNSGEGSVQGDRPSEIAEQLLAEHYPTEDGLTALVVFHQETGFITEDHDKISAFSEWLASEDKPKEVSSALPYHFFPDSVREQLMSDDGTTLLFPVALLAGISTNDAQVALDHIQSKVQALGLTNLKVEITGPAGIMADTVNLFKSADVVLILTTVVLIFIILILIYRSPLLAFTPLFIAGIVYGGVDRILGFVGKQGWFVIESQAVSIMLVLLFAVLTDYSLFVFSRYREQLRQQESKYEAMDEAMHHVSEPILFSGGTVFLAMLTLFVTVFEPYHHFAPVFSIAVVVILLAGLTLIPSVFALLGRRAFWPFIPKVTQTSVSKPGFWHKVSKQVKRRPVLWGGVLLLGLLIGAANFTTVEYSFNLLKSFPEDISSRQGFELLEKHYPPGQLAPATVVLHTEQKMETDASFLEKIKQLQARIEAQPGIESVSPELTEEMLTGEANLPRNFLAEGQQALQLEVILAHNPYDQEALDTIKALREQADTLLKQSGLTTAETGSDYTLHYAGQTAKQLDIDEMNRRDMIFLFTIVTVLLTLVLAFQTRSWLLPLLMMSTILLSYFAALGFSWWIFKYGLGYEAISYRLPVYTFVFMVALGIDYNIMLVSRIREQARKLPWQEAVQTGVSLTGGVISSAGVILAATFSVLMTQPIEDLFLFGFTMCLGILLDTFLIRGILLPSLLLVTYRKGIKQTQPQ